MVWQLHTQIIIEGHEQQRTVLNTDMLMPDSFIEPTDYMQRKKLEKDEYTSIIFLYKKQVLLTSRNYYNYVSNTS